MAGRILFFFGADTYRSAEKLAALRQRYIDKSLGDTNLAILDGAALSLEHWLRETHAFPFLASSRLVIVKNLLLQGKKDAQDAIAAKLEAIPASTVVVFYEAGVPDQRTKLFKRLNRAGSAEQFNQLTGPARQRWLAERLGPARLEPASLAWLSQRPLDLWQLAGIVEQIQLYADGKDQPLTVGDIQPFVPVAEAGNTFRLIEAASRGLAREALIELDALLTAGEAELYLVSMLAYQYRVLVVVAEACAGGQRSVGAIARTTKLSPFVIEKALPIARVHPPEYFIRRLARIFEYDYEIKTGLIEPRLGVELLIKDLADPLEEHDDGSLELFPTNR